MRYGPTYRNLDGTVVCRICGGADPNCRVGSESPLQRGGVMPVATFGWFIRDLLEWRRNRRKGGL